MQEADDSRCSQRESFRFGVVLHQAQRAGREKPFGSPSIGKGDSPLLADKEGREEAQEEQPDLVTLRTEYATFSQQLEQRDAHKQAGQWALLYKQVRAAEARLRQAELETSPSQTSPPEDAKQQAEFAKQRAEFAKHQAAAVSEEGEAKPPAETAATGERRAQLRTIASDLLYWKGGLKVLRMAKLPKWRGSFQWQIEAKIEALQAAYVLFSDIVT